MSKIDLITDALEIWQKMCLDNGRASSELGIATKAFAAARELQAEKESTLQEISDIGQEIEQKPVASIYISSSGEREFDDWNCALPIGRNELYTAPPKREWQGLTFDEIFRIFRKMDSRNVFVLPPEHDFARAIEAKLKEKNT